MKFRTRFFLVIVSSLLTILSACTSQNYLESPPATTPPSPSKPPHEEVNPPPASATTVGSSDRMYCGDEDMFFFSNPSTGYSLWCVNGDEQKCIDDSECSSLFSDETYVYYSCLAKDISLRTSPNPSLCKIRFDGTEKEVLSDDATLVGLTDDRLYFTTSDSQLRSMSITGDDEVVILQDTYHNSFYTLSSDYIFFSNLSDSDEHGLYRMDADGNNLQKLFDGYAIWTYVFDSYLYFIDNSEKLVRMNFDGDEKEIIAEGNYGRIVVDTDWIFFADFDTEPSSLCKIRHNGSEKTILFSEQVVTSINKVGDLIYFFSSTPEQKRCITTEGTLISDN